MESSNLSASAPVFLPDGSARSRGEGRGRRPRGDNPSSRTGAYPEGDIAAAGQGLEAGPSRPSRHPHPNRASAAVNGSGRPDQPGVGPAAAAAASASAALAPRPRAGPRPGRGRGRGQGDGYCPGGNAGQAPPPFQAPFTGPVPGGDASGTAPPATALPRPGYLLQQQYLQQQQQQQQPYVQQSQSQQQQFQQQGYVDATQQQYQRRPRHERQQPAAQSGTASTEPGARENSGASSLQHAHHEHPHGNDYAEARYGRGPSGAGLDSSTTAGQGGGDASAAAAGGRGGSTTRGRGRGGRQGARGPGRGGQRLPSGEGGGGPTWGEATDGAVEARSASEPPEASAHAVGSRLAGGGGGREGAAGRRGRGRESLPGRGRGGRGGRGLDVVSWQAPGVAAAGAAGARGTPAAACGLEPGSSGAGGGSDGGGEGGDGCEDGVVETLACIVCCEEASAVAVGRCGHPHTCARCCLRLRLCYSDLRCPMCKTVNEEVVVLRPPLPADASFEALVGPQALGPGGQGPQGQGEGALWQQPRWAKGVLVYEPPGQRRRGRPLHSSLMAMTARSCSVCDPQGRQPFGAMKLLLGHLRSAHDRALCDICLSAGLKFPTEYPPYDAGALAAHISAAHPRCDYCATRFYGRDELYAHMTQLHFTCHVCMRLGNHQLYFRDAQSLQAHQSEVHHVCEHPECWGCMIAFGTEDELHTHIRDRHSAHMPRWDQSRARPLLLDFMASRGAGFPNDPADRDAQGGGGRGPRRGGRMAAPTRGPSPPAPTRQRAPAGLHSMSAFPSLSAQAPPQAQGQGQHPGAAHHVGLGDAQDVEGGLAVIDDDLGMGVGMGVGGGGGRGGAQGQTQGRGAERGAAARRNDPDSAGPGEGPGARVAGVWAGRTPGSGTFREDFPELATAAGGPAQVWGAWGTARPTAGPAAGGGGGAGGGAGLQKVTVRCRCGRRVDHLALKADEQVPALPCDRECSLVQRRAQLADAFGVSSADSHVPYFERHRTPNYSVALIQAAQAAGPEWVSALERELARFLADPSARRFALPGGMSQAQRRLVHELAAEHYGLVTHSVGQGSARAVQLLRSPASGEPTRLLSVIAAVTGPEELARLAAAAPATSWALRLVDVAPGANVQHYLRSWEGDYTLSSAPSSSASASSGGLIVTFSREAAFKDCCTTLAGGVRGVFRTVVERQPAGGAAAAAPQGWQVLRSAKTGAAGAGTSGVKKAVGAGAGAAGGGGAPERGAEEKTAAVRAAMAADAFGEPDAADWAAAPAPRAVSQAAAAPASAAWLPGRGPPLDLAKETVWAALSEEAEGEGVTEGEAEVEGGTDAVADGEAEAECSWAALSAEEEELAKAGTAGGGKGGESGVPVAEVPQVEGLAGPQVEGCLVGGGDAGLEAEGAADGQVEVGAGVGPQVMGEAEARVEVAAEQAQ